MREKIKNLRIKKEIMQEVEQSFSSSANFQSQQNFENHVEKLDRHVAALHNSILSEIYYEIMRDGGCFSSLSPLSSLNLSCLEEILHQYPYLYNKYNKRISRYLSMERKLKRLNLQR